MKPPKKEMARLFRGEPHFSNIQSKPFEAAPGQFVEARTVDAGRWFTSSIEIAKEYAEGGRLIFIDIPKSKLKDYHITNFGVGGSSMYRKSDKVYYLPPEIEAKAMMVGPPPGEITRSLVRGDLEAGKAFRQVAGGRSSLKVEPEMLFYKDLSEVRLAVSEAIEKLRPFKGE